VFLRLLPKVLQVLGIEVIFLGFICWIATLEVRYDDLQYLQTTDGTAVSNLASPDYVAPPEYVYSLVAVADLTQALTPAPPYIAPTILGILLIVVGAALGGLVANR
jgi:hypothetical protein